MSFHPRNRHQGHYDLDALRAALPEFAPYVKKNKYGNDSIDFANPAAVKSLNRALLKSYYGIEGWEIPPNSLCPPIPGRADYIHLLADLLTPSSGVIPRGSEVRILDLGVGANCIYPIIGHSEYDWSFVGSDINSISIEAARKILKANPGLASAVELRLQERPARTMEGIILPGEHFHAVMCNPPFHASLEDAQAGTRRKWNNLGKTDLAKKEKQLVNFGGEGAELWCEGGEMGFIRRMIRESVDFAAQCSWFSTLVSRDEHLQLIDELLRTARVKDAHILEMAQGQKKSRIAAWTF